MRQFSSAERLASYAIRGKWHHAHDNPEQFAKANRGSVVLYASGCRLCNEDSGSDRNNQIGDSIKPAQAFLVGLGICLSTRGLALVWRG